MHKIILRITVHEIDRPQKSKRVAKLLVGMARCAVTARVQRVERILKDVRITAHVAPLNAAPDGAARHP